MFVEFEYKVRKNVALKQADLELVEMWISRAGSLPLEPAFNYRRYNCARDPIQHLLFPQIQQCRDISLRVPHNFLQPLMGAAFRFVRRTGVINSTSARGFAALVSYSDRIAFCAATF